MRFLLMRWSWRLEAPSSSSGRKLSNSWLYLPISCLYFSFFLTSPLTLLSKFLPHHIFLPSSFQTFSLLLLYFFLMFSYYFIFKLNRINIITPNVTSFTWTKYRLRFLVRCYYYFLQFHIHEWIYWY
jgi:hypothetical protein